MKYASDFRRIACESLRGNWLIAVLVGLIVSLLGGMSDGIEFDVTYTQNVARLNLQLAGRTIFSLGDGALSGFESLFLSALAAFSLFALLFAIAWYILGGIIMVGYARFNLTMLDGEKPSIDAIFSGFSRWQTAACARLLMGLYVLLWSLLFVIPGIIASYSYAMTRFILADNPDMTASEAIRRSKQMMSGNRWRLFCLHLSFIGWSILATLAFGIGHLWLHPYKQAASAAFYLDLCEERPLE